MIKWSDIAGDGEIHLLGVVGKKRKYVMWQWDDLPLRVDVYGVGKWLDLDIPVESIEHGKHLCEMWEATGAY